MSELLYEGVLLWDTIQNLGYVSLNSLTTGEIQRDLSEITYEISFISDQVRIEIDSYSLQRLQEVESKLSLMRHKREILKKEYERRRKEESK